jgi:hypothetical protein
LAQKNKVVKSVSFNLTNEKDLEMLERIEHVNFSGYMKRLIEKDMKSRRVFRNESKQPSDGHLANGPIMVKGETNLALILE